MADLASVETSGATATRILPLAGRHGGSAVAHVSPAEPASRISLRAPAESVAALSAAFGVELPTKPKTSASAGARIAMWLGPDEWQLIDADGVDLVSVAQSSGTLHSAVDISFRNTAAIVSGSKADVALNAACPQDLSLEVFPVGACSRTIFGKADIVILRTDEQTFRIEFWRSFSDYVFGLLSETAEDAAY